MATTIKHLQKRNGIFYYVRRVPSAVKADRQGWKRAFQGRSLYRVSLRTGDLSEALGLLPGVEQKYRRLLALAVEGLSQSVQPVATSTEQPLRRLTQALLREVERSVANERIANWRRMRVIAELGGDALDYFEYQKELREQEAGQILDVLVDMKEPKDPRQLDPKDHARRMADTQGYHAPPGSAEFAALTSAVRQGLLRGERSIDTMLNGGSVDLFPPESNTESPAKTGPLLSVVRDDYLARGSRGRTSLEVQTVFKRLIAMQGDKPVGEISGEHIRDFCRQEAAVVVGGKDPNALARASSPATLKKKFGLVRAAINHSIAIGRFSGPNPCVGIDATVYAKPVDPALMPEKRALRIPEMNEIFRHPWFTGCRSGKATYLPGTHRLSDSRFWAPVVAALTGMRAGEIAGLQLSEIALDDAHPHIIVRPNQFRSTKNGRQRRVPIIDCLREIGFEEFVAAARANNQIRLFEDWVAPQNQSLKGVTHWANSKIIRAFNRTVIPSCLPHISGTAARQEVTFHSFRGAFKTLLGHHRFAIPRPYIDEVIGHAKSDLDTAYVGEIPIEATYDAIHKCRYDGLILPTQ